MTDEKRFTNPMSLVKVKGFDVFKRTHLFSDAVQSQVDHQVWLYSKTAMTTPGATSKGHDINGNIFEGPNFASQDYLGLGTNHETREEAVRVTREFGIHSGGAALAFGNHPYFLDFTKEIGEYLGTKHAIAYPTGWMAGYGIIKGLIREYDHIVMDKLSHNCLQEGAKASTKNIHVIDHLDSKAMIRKCAELRQKDADVAIMLITESLYSMDSDTPDLIYLQQESKKLKCFLLIDMAHDLGAIGERGLGAVETQNLTDLSNVLLMGSGSKVFGTNIGFVGCVDHKVIDYLKILSPPYMFSNVAAPPACAAALFNLRIVRSEKGRQLRKKLLENSIYLRKRMAEEKFECLGSPSAIVIVMLGDELTSRLTARIMLNRGVIVNGIEFPVVPMGKARLRLQLQAIHSKEHLDQFIVNIIEARKEAKEIRENLSSFIKTPKL